MSDDQITEFLTMILYILVPVVILLAIIWVALTIKGSKKIGEKSVEKKIIEDPIKTKKEYNKKSIYDFMDFEDIVDNMIIKKNRVNYLMVLECKGINYDLMSGVEKNSIEQGFLQFLNTIRYPIQMYIQTRTVNLNESLRNYNIKIDEVKKDFLNKQMTYNAISNSYDYSDKQKADIKREYIKARNLYEYGVDILNDTAKMNQNKNILNKHYYIILSYMPEESDREGCTDDEVRNMAFSDLYTKAMSLTSLLAPTGIKSKVLNSKELAELLYISYNRDDSELLELEKALNSGYMELYSTAKDVIEKREIAINNQIKEKANELANDTAVEVYNNIEKMREIEAKEREMQDIINMMAKTVLDDNVENLGKEVVEKSKEVIDKKTEEKKKKKMEKNKDNKKTTKEEKIKKGE